jgi:hypothetical protein
MNIIARALCLTFLLGCPAPGPSPAAIESAAEYGARLEECNRTAKNCDESIACENKLRAARGRPLRDPKGGCQ